ncbi:MAG: hypothetical protein KAS32_14275 [Candidatus Peribacteraceae bacterium]|nr:hypothetical protein [Candidatus Peribacteraceae bacterium]
MTRTIKEWQTQIEKWDAAFLKRQIDTINNLYYEIFDTFRLNDLLNIMETELNNRISAERKRIAHRGMRYEMSKV